MKKINLFIYFILLFVVLSGCSTESTNEQENLDPFVIKAGHAGAMDHFAHNTFEKFKEIVEQNSNGQITVEIYPNSELGGEREMLEMVLHGEITMIAPASAPLDAVSKYMTIWDLPYLFPDHATAHRVLDGEVGQEVLDSLADKGIIGLAYWENGFRHLTNNVQPITDVADMDGLHIRTLENPMQIKAWSLTGANATPIAFNELYDALQQGAVQAQETPLSLMYSMNFHEVQDYLTLTGHTYSPWPVVMNKQFFDALSPELQQVVQDAAIEVREYNRQLSREDEEHAQQLLMQAGMEITELSDEKKAAFKDSMEEIYTDVKEDVGDELFNKLMQAVQ